ncbi:uncharacterized protein LOC134538127 [Bacillus rossius redtenbacheri]|uniref:uncharacterized protein LOC134538127 n=1 Tax=Bacillus rossius redtenbacheri TaxID=93214 RepID=UPI002FDD2852
MTTAVAASMQAALYVRQKQKLRKKKIRRGRVELPSNVATKEIAPFPRYPPNSWSQQGKAAWQERGGERRPSVTEVAVNHRIKATEAHRRWMKRNRIHDSSYGGSSSDDDDDYPGGPYGHQSAAANGLLYVGLGTVAIGLVIFFVGTGEKGFKTLELRLIGPSLIAGGALCCLVRVFLCVCPSRCLRRRRRRRRKGRPACPGQDIPLVDRCPLGAAQRGDLVTSTTVFLQHERRPAPGLPNVVVEEDQDPQPCTSRQRRGPPDHVEEQVSLLAGEDEPEAAGRPGELVLSPSKLQP